MTVFGALKDSSRSGLYWALLTVGSTFILLLLLGVVLYLVLSIKAINLTRRQSNFIDSVTHELKSPIASMKLYLQTLSRHQVSEQMQADFHRFMLEDLERLDHLINQMLDAGRLDAERPKGEEEDVELAALLHDCAAAVCMNYRVPAETVRLELQPNVVVGRRIDLDVIFRNLVDNAVKYAGSPPRVEVSLRRDGDGPVIVRIADNGRGIPAAPAAEDFRPLRAAGAGTGTREAGHRPGPVHRPHAGPPPARPDSRPRSRKRPRHRLRGATAGKARRRRRPFDCANGRTVNRPEGEEDERLR